MDGRAGKTGTAEGREGERGTEYHPSRLLVRRRVAGRERLLRPLVNLVRTRGYCRPRHLRGGPAQGLRLLATRQQLAEHVRKNSAVQVVEHFLRRVDSDGSAELH